MLTNPEDIDLDRMMDAVNERRALVAARLKADPLPNSEKEARLQMKEEIEKYGLVKHIVDLEMDGYTILPPDFGAPLKVAERMRKAILRIAAERDEAQLNASISPNYGVGRGYFHVLADDPVFEEAVMSPVMLALVTYLCGYRARLALTSAHIKTNESDAALYFHTDISSNVAPPWPEYSLGANVNWLLTDYNRENGALCVVPGSHLWRRPPPPEFLNAHNHPDVHVVNAPAGSLVVWHSGLWHGAIPRTAAGARITLISYFVRPMHVGTEPFWLTTTKEMIERNPARFGVLMGLQELSPWGRRGARLDVLGSPTRDLGKWT